MPICGRPGGASATASVPANFHHFWGDVFPSRHAQTLAEIERYPWPEVRLDYRHEHLEEQVEELQEQSFFVDGFAGHLFETSWQLVGFEKMFVDMVENPALVEAVLGRITEDACFRARQLAEAGVDMLRTGDDVGMEHRLMMHPRLWRRFLKPCLARVIAAAREVDPEIPVWYHSDSDIGDTESTEGTRSKETVRRFGCPNRLCALRVSVPPWYFGHLPTADPQSEVRG